MLKQLRPALFMLLAMTVITGLIYPLVITGIAQVAVPASGQRQPDRRRRRHRSSGSALIGQSFSRPDYFWGRPSAAGTGYDAANSSGSNLAASNKAYIDGRGPARRRAEGRQPGGEASDPGRPGHGERQRPRPAHLARRRLVAGAARRAARNWPEDNVRRLVHDHIEGRQLGVLGEPRVNVLRLNRALDAASR